MHINSKTSFICIQLYISHITVQLTNLIDRKWFLQSSANLLTVQISMKITYVLQKGRNLYMFKMLSIKSRICKAVNKNFWVRMY